MKIKVKATPKPCIRLAAARLRGGAGAHQSEASPASTACSSGWRGV
ncbi:MAG: hypothetical protein ACOH2S_07385 [Janthinobacterium svalbardensis]|nr:hypothetical protein [Janthinobacterium svalbardensis]